MTILSHIWGTDLQVTNNMNMYYKMVGQETKREVGFYDYLKHVNFDGEMV